VRLGSFSPVVLRSVKLVILPAISVILVVILTALPARQLGSKPHPMHVAALMVINNKAQSLQTVYQLLATIAA
jgi:hypothetical protein